jgi:hypothetical protein
MKKSLLVILIAFLLIDCGLPASPPNPVEKSSDCNQGKQCSTSFDCGEIGVCYCQYDWLEEQETGGGIPQYGTCYFE